MTRWEDGNHRSPFSDDPGGPQPGGPMSTGEKGLAADQAAEWSGTLPGTGGGTHAQVSLQDR